MNAKNLNWWPLVLSLAACQPAQPGAPAGPGTETADLLIVNGTVFAADEAGTTAQGVAVRGNTIMPGLLPEYPDRTRVIQDIVAHTELGRSTMMMTTVPRNTTAETTRTCSLRRLRHSSRPLWHASNHRKFMG